MEIGIIQAKIKELDLEEGEEAYFSGNTLLGTIQIPRNLHVLQDKLPKPHYRTKADEKEKESFVPTIAQAGRRNRSTKDNRPKARLIDSGNSIIKNRYSIEHNPRNAIRSSQQYNLDLSTSDSNKIIIEPIKEVNAENFEMKLPDIRRGVAPIKKPPPRIRYNKEQYENPYRQPRKIDQSNIANIYEENARLRKVYEEISRKKAGYYPLPVYNQPVAQNIYSNQSYEYKKPIIVQPSWWG